MDSNRLTNLLDNIYIPDDKSKNDQGVPRHHPSLVMQDYQTDTTHHLDCGCCGGDCIKQKAWWSHEKSQGSKNARPSVRSTTSSNSVYASSVSSED